MPRNKPSSLKGDVALASAKKQYRESAYGGPNEAAAKTKMEQIKRVQKGDSMATKAINAVRPKAQKMHEALKRSAGANFPTPRNQPAMMSNGGKAKKGC
jgi:hypothetical protein